MRVTASDGRVRKNSRRRRSALALFVAVLVVLGTLGIDRFLLDEGDVIRPGEGWAVGAMLTTPQLITRAVEGGRIDVDEGWVQLATALYRPQELDEAFRSPAPWGATHAILGLQRALADDSGEVAGGSQPILPTPMSSAARARIEDIRTRSAQDPATVREAPDGASRRCFNFSAVKGDVLQTEHFHIEFDPADLAGRLPASDYGTSLEAAYAKEAGTGSGQFAWPPPPAATNPAPGGRIHVRIESGLGSVLGFATNDGTHAGPVGNNPNTSWTETDADAACLVLTNDFSVGSGVTPRAKLDATTSHEFNHVLQFGMGSLRPSREPDLSFTEGLSVLMEDEVFDDANLGAIRRWPRFEESLGEHGEDDVYNFWVLFRGLFERYGTTTPGGTEQAAQEFWQTVSQVGIPGNTTGRLMLEALSKVLGDRGTTLPDAYHAYAVAVRFSKACGSGLSYPNCLEEGPQWLQLKGPLPTHRDVTQVGAAPVTGSLQDDYSLNWVSLPVGASYDVTVRNTAPAGAGKLRTSAVCETSTGLVIRQLPQVVVGGATSTLGGFDARNCVKAVAVITNEANTVANPASSAVRSYEVVTVAAQPGGGGGGGGGGGDSTTTSTTSGSGTTSTTRTGGSATTSTTRTGGSGNATSTTVCRTTTSSSTSSSSSTSTSASSTTSTTLAGVTTSTTRECDPEGPLGRGRGGGPQCHGRQTTLRGTNGNDTLIGTSGRDVIHAGEGNDVIEGLGGDDIICGGAGGDRIDGGGGDDEIHGGAGNDRIFGGRGNDRLKGGPGADRLFGGDGEDEIRGGDGNDRISGGRGDDGLHGDGGRDRLLGGIGRDSFAGGADEDKLADSSTGSRGVGSQGGG